MSTYGEVKWFLQKWTFKASIGIRDIEDIPYVSLNIYKYIIITNSNNIFKYMLYLNGHRPAYALKVLKQKLKETIEAF